MSLVMLCFPCCDEEQPPQVMLNPFPTLKTLGLVVGPIFLPRNFVKYLKGLPLFAEKKTEN